MKKIVTLLSFGFFLTFIGCNKQLVEDPVGSSTDFTFKVEAADASNGSPETRSSYASNLQNKITDFSIFVFDAEGTFVSKNYYAGSDNMKGRDLFINDELGTTFDDEFVVYIIANLGDLRNNSALCTNGIPAYNKIENYSYSFSNNFSEFNNKGFPMAGYYESYCPSTDSRTLYANKIVTQYNIRFTKSSGNNNTYTITGGKLANVANVCTPFKTFIASNSQTTSNGDSFTSSDVSVLNSGNYASLFILENEQGIVFPNDVTEENEKKLENLPTAYLSRCSYVEFYVNVQTPTATYENVIYRYFFGDGVRDCSIHRNMVYDLTMNFDNVFVEDEGWRIEPGDPDVHDDALRLSVPQLSIVKGISNSFNVLLANNVSYRMTYSSSKANDLGVTINKTSHAGYDTYSVSTSYNDGKLHYGFPRVAYDDLILSFDTDDGLIHKEFTLRVVTSAIPVRFSYVNGILYGHISKCVDWPSGFSYKWNINMDLYATCCWRHNWIANNWAFGVRKSSYRTCNTVVLQSGDPEDQEIQDFVIDNSSTLRTYWSNLNSYKEDHKKNLTGSQDRYYVPTCYIGTVEAGFFTPSGGSFNSIPQIYYDQNHHVLNPDGTINRSGAQPANPFSMQAYISKVPAVSAYACFGDSSDDGYFSTAGTYYVNGGVSIQTGGAGYFIQETDIGNYDVNKVYYQGTQQSSYRFHVDTRIDFTANWPSASVGTY